MPLVPPRWSARRAAVVSPDRAAARPRARGYRWPRGPRRRRRGPPTCPRTPASPDRAPSSGRSPESCTVALRRRMYGCAARDWQLRSTGLRRTVRGLQVSSRSRVHAMTVPLSRGDDALRRGRARPLADAQEHREVVAQLPRQQKMLAHAVISGRAHPPPFLGARATGLAVLISCPGCSNCRARSSHSAVFLSSAVEAQVDQDVGVWRQDRPTRRSQ